MFRRLTPVNVATLIGLASILTLAISPSSSRAQTNIDQGKSPAEMFAGDCAVCHKTTRGLANGRNNLTLSIFLREHYTASREQAAALAAYVLNSGGNAPASKPTVEHAKSEEPKGQEPKNQEPKNQEPKSQESKSQERRNPEPKGQEARTAPSPAPSAAPHQRGHEETPPPEPTPVAATPAEPTGAEPGPTTSAAAPAESELNDNAPVPRDNIPD